MDAGVTVDIGTVLPAGAGSATGRTRPGEAHVAEPRAPSRSRTAQRPRALLAVVQRIAAEHGIDLDAVRAPGRDGRVRKQDVLALVERGARADAEPPLHIESPYRPTRRRRRRRADGGSRSRACAARSAST